MNLEAGEDINKWPLVSQGNTDFSTLFLLISIQSLAPELWAHTACLWAGAPSGGLPHRCLCLPTLACASRRTAALALHRDALCASARWRQENTEMAFRGGSCGRLHAARPSLGPPLGFQNQRVILKRGFTREGAGAEREAPWDSREERFSFFLRIICVSFFLHGGRD